MISASLVRGGRLRALVQRDLIRRGVPPRGRRAYNRPVVRPHREHHLSGRSGWLRAAVLGANDGIVSVAAIIVGVAAAQQSTRAAILTAGVAGWVAGAASMAAGEYVSVSTQADAETADMALERRELGTDPEAEQAELAGIYRARGISAQ